MPKFLHSTVPSLYSHQNTMAVSKSNLYTRSKSTSFKSINEAQVCVGKSCFLTPKRPAFSTEEIKGKELVDMFCKYRNIER